MGLADSLKDAVIALSAQDIGAKLCIAAAFAPLIPDLLEDLAAEKSEKLDELSPEEREQARAEIELFVMAAGFKRAAEHCAAIWLTKSAKRAT